MKKLLYREQKIYKKSQTLQKRSVWLVYSIADGVYPQTVLFIMLYSADSSPLDIINLKYLHIFLPINQKKQYIH